MNTKQIPIEHTLDPGEAVLPPAAVDTMATILALGGASDEPVVAQESDTSIATIAIFVILAYLGVKLILRFLPWVLGLGLVITLLTML